MTATTNDYLTTYLQDHRAGAEFGSDLARRLADENLDTPYEDFLLQLAQQIAQDVGVLDELMERLGVSRAALKTAGAKIGEKLGRLKPNNELVRYSPLSRVLELESLRAGVQGKLGLWDSLAQLAPADERLDLEQMTELIARAERQLEGLREHHLLAAAEAFVEA